jgi:DNA topoisomerase-3
VGPLEGFRSKMGRPFSAAVRVGDVEDPEKPGEKNWKVEFAFENERGENGGPAQLDPATAKPLGETPLGQLFETDAAYFLQPTDAKAKPIRMGKVICQRSIPAEQALKIFREGKTDLLPRFISKKGKPFAAYLKLEGTKVGFEFEPRQKKPAAKKAVPKAA